MRAYEYPAPDCDDDSIERVAPVPGSAEDRRLAALHEDDSSPVQAVEADPDVYAYVAAGQSANVAGDPHARAPHATEAAERRLAEIEDRRGEQAAREPAVEDPKSTPKPKG